MDIYFNQPSTIC